MINVTDRLVLASRDTLEWTIDASIGAIVQTNVNFSFFCGFRKDHIISDSELVHKLIQLKC